MTKAAELGLIRPGELAVFCQLIGGLSTVKVVEFAGLSDNQRTSVKIKGSSTDISRQGPGGGIVQNNRPPDVEST
jgi:hypothetical protein